MEGIGMGSKTAKAHGRVTVKEMMSKDGSQHYNNTPLKAIWSRIFLIHISKPI